VLGMPIVNDAGEAIDQGLGLFPMSDLEQVDTWFVAGMKSSGSISLKADNAFVPNHRVLSMPRAIEGDYPTEMRSQEALYRSPFIPILAIVLVGPILGLGRAALEFVRQKANSRTIAYTFFEKQSASVAFQLQVAEAAMMIDTAHFHAYRAADDVDTAAVREQQLFDGLGDFLDHIAGIGPHPRARQHIRINAAHGRRIDVLRRAIGVEMRGVDHHGGFGDLQLERHRRALLLEERISDSARIGFLPDEIESRTAEPENWPNQNDRQERNEGRAV